MMDSKLVRAMEAYIENLNWSASQEKEGYTAMVMDEIVWEIDEIIHNESEQDRLIESK